MRNAPLIPSAVLAAVFVLAFVAATPVHSWARSTDIWSRAILHADGSRTLSKRNLDTRVIEQLTYDRSSRLMLKRVYQLDAAGKEQRGFVYDANNQLIFRIGYLYDEIGRLKEEVLYNNAGDVVRRVVHSYDSSGRPHRPQAYTFIQGRGGALDPSNVMQRPGEEREVREMTPGGRPTSAPEKKKKPGIFKRIFGGKR